MEIVKATKIDHLVLTNITKRSKAFWGYPSDWLQLWDDDLTITQSYFEHHEVFKLVKESVILGYCSFCREPMGTARLDNLFIDPPYMRKGYGQKLLDHLIFEVQLKGFRRILLDSDPNAVDFYKKNGFKIIGKVKTQIPDRFLPVMEKKL